MSKTIWYISKYCNIKTKNSSGSRGWHLAKEFSLKGYRSVIFTSDFENFVHFHNTNSNFKILSKDGVKIVLIKTLKYTIAKSFLRIFSWFDFEFNLFFLNKKLLPKPDAIIVSSLSLLTILNGLILKKKYRCKLVFEIRDIWPLTLVEEGGFSVNNPFIMFLAFIERLGYKQSDLIIGTMPNLTEHIKKILGYSKPAHCIPMGVDLDSVREKKYVAPEYIKKYLKTGHFKVIYTGTVGITNALDVFFETAKVLIKNSKIRFIVVGDGALRKHYLKKYGNLPNIIYFPKVHKNQIQSILAYADVLYFSVFKSKVWKYGQSLNKIIDYMISGKPIIASYSGYTSMIDEARCGYYIPAEDKSSLVRKIKEMTLMTKSELNAMGARGFSWLLKNRLYKNIANDYLRLLFKLNN